MISSGMLFKFSSGCSKNFLNQNRFSKEAPLEVDQFFSFSVSCLLFWLLLLRYKIDNWSRETHAHLRRAPAFQVLLFSSSDYTSLCLHPSSLNLSFNILLMDKSAIYCMDLIYVLISKSSLLKIKYHIKCSLNLNFG